MTSDDESIYEELNHSRKKKRRKGNDGHPIPPKEPFSMQPLLDLLNDDETPFEDAIDGLLPEYLRDRAVRQEKESEKDGTGQTLRPLTRSDVASFVDGAAAGRGTAPWSVSQAIALRKLKLGQERRRAGYAEHNISTFQPPASAEQKLLPAGSAYASEAPRGVVEALEAITTTPFENSLLARLHGVVSGADIPGLVSVDWETSTPWMRLMGDIRAHYVLAHPERDAPLSTARPITYTALQPWHLDQVHDLLWRAFWSGIDVSDSLEYSPERCTIVAAHGHLVVGVAILSSPRETYITYLAVRAGWDNAQIATTMLYHLITLNPHQDITLHVSANNSAMLLYNRFGFKAEEFVAGFYDAYLDPNSRTSKNAFRLRLRQH